MREFSYMFSPEYTITNNTLKNIATSEYARSLIENTTLLQNWIKHLVRDAQTRTIYYSLIREGINTDFETTKRFISEMPTTPTLEMKKYLSTLEHTEKLARRLEFDENDIKSLYKSFYGNSAFRRTSIDNAAPAPEILAEISALLDWYNSLDAKETHPLIVTAILKARFEYIAPFDKGNFIMGDLITKVSLKISNFDVKDYYALEEYFAQTQRTYSNLLKDAIEHEDYTRWIEYFTEGFSREIATIAENVKILARDTKIAKAAGSKARLSDRQEKIVEYLQDFGMLTNKDFPRLFPNISEDTVLRELKGLIKKEIVTKRGSTKSSRYELV